MGEEKNLKSNPCLSHCRTLNSQLVFGGALTLPMGVQGPPYRSDVDGHKNARHGFLAGFPAVSL